MSGSESEFSELLYYERGNGMTPYELKFLIHLHTTPAKWSNDDTELYRNVVNCFEAEGVIEVNGDKEAGWQLTKLGEAWLEVILHVPKPKPCFVDYAGKVLPVI